MPNECEWLLRYGIYDTKEVAIDRYTVEHLRYLLTHSNAGSISEFEKEGGSGALGIMSVFDLKLGGESARSNFRAWRNEFLRTSTTDLINKESLKTVVKQISPVLMEAVKKCLDTPRTGTLVAWVEPTDDLTFTLRLKYNRHDLEDAIIKRVDVISTPEGECSVPEGQEELIAEGKAIVAVGEGTAVVVQRTSASVAVTITVNTDKGSKNLRIPGVDERGTMAQLTEKIAAEEMIRTALDNTIAQLQHIINDYATILNTVNVHFFYPIPGLAAKLAKHGGVPEVKEVENSILSIHNNWSLEYHVRLSGLIQQLERLQGELTGARKSIGDS